MHRRPDVSCRQLLNEAVAPDAEGSGAQPEDVEVPSVFHPRAANRDLERGLVRESLGVAARDLAPPGLETLELRELRDPERRLDVGHGVLETRQYDVVAPALALLVPTPGVAAHPVQAHDPRTLDELRVAHEHAALGCRDILRGVEAERHGIQPRPDAPVLIARGKGVSRVL